METTNDVGTFNTLVEMYSLIINFGELFLPRNILSNTLWGTVVVYLRSLSQTKEVRVTWNPRQVSNVGPKWYSTECGTFCSLCSLGYDFDDSYKALLLSRARGQPRGPRCIRCGKVLRTRSKTRPNLHGGFWKKVDKIEGEQ